MTTPDRVLIVDDDRIFSTSLAGYLEESGYRVDVCHDAQSARSALRAADTSGTPIAVALLDVNLPDDNGIHLLGRIAEDHPDVVAIMMTGYGTIEGAVRAIRTGAFEYLSKPIAERELEMVLTKAIRQHALLDERRSLRQRVGGGGKLIGHDHRLVRAMELAETAAGTDATVLMTGESGTGKSVVARAVHEKSGRRDGPFVELHCGSIPETLLESELFGHVKGAFTGADADKKGRFEAAHGGTILIDEINSASGAMQLKLLRVLQERRFERVGSTTPIDVDVRVILASNQPLERLVSEGTFRQDLYYRINVVRIDLPPLRDRVSDIPVLVENFMREMSARHNRQIVRIEDAAMAALERHTWPGNVRELQNAIERAVVLSRGPTLTLEDLPPELTDSERSPLALASGTDDEPWRPIPLSEALKAPERNIILKALRANQWNRQATADQLEINRTTLYKKMRSLGIDRLAG